MSGMCKMAPTVHKKVGDKMEETNSKLFTAIKKAVKDYDLAWKIWGYTKTQDFKEKYTDLQYDEFGEVTFPSLVKALGLEDAYNQEKSIEEVTRDYGFDKTFEDANMAANNMNLFNGKEEKYVAVLEKVKDGYKIKVLPRVAANVTKAIEQSYNNALTKEIIDLLNSLGFNVSFVSNPRYAGLFDPTNAKLHDGLIEIIKIAKGQRGEDALPEEFSHLIIEGLIEHPLVKRLLEALNQEQVEEILGKAYDSYYRMYNGDFLKLKKEAAGKLLADHIMQKGTITQPQVRNKKPLLSRVWGWAKNMFSKVTGRQLEDARTRAHNAVAGIYSMIASKEAIPLIDKQSILKASELYQLQQSIKNLETVAYSGEFVLAKVLRNESSKSKNRKRKRRIEKRLKSIQQLNESDKTYESVHKFLEEAGAQIEEIQVKQKEVKNAVEGEDPTDIKAINDVARVARQVDEFISGYENLLKEISTFSSEDVWSTYSSLPKEDGEALANVANQCLHIVNQLVEWRADINRKIVLNASRTVYKADIVKGIGSGRDEVMSLETIMEYADRDISFADRWVTAMSDADDALLVIFEQLVKNQQYQRDMEMIEWNAFIAKADKELRDAGGNPSFMLEIGEDGVPTGRIKSEYDWEGYNEARKQKVKELEEQKQKENRSERWFQREIRNWDNERLIYKFVDPDLDEKIRTKKIRKKDIPKDAVYERVPDPEIFSKNKDVINNFSEAEKKYYDKMLWLKRTMMTKIPHRGQAIYKAVYISKDMIEGMLDNSVGNPLKAVLENYKKKFLRRPDDLGFGTGEDFKDDIKEIIQNEEDNEKAAYEIIKTLNDATDNDIIAYISPYRLKLAIKKNRNDLKAAVDAVLEVLAKENFAIVDTDFADHRIQRLPIYYTRKLKDMKMLSTDFSSTMVAYTAMAVNYEKMNEVVDVLEIGRDFIDNRDFKETEGNRTVQTMFKAANKAYRRFVTRAGASSMIAGRYKDWMDSVVYEERKESAGTVEVFGTNIDVAKTLDTIKDYTGLLGLGFNLFSTVSNMAVGKLQQWIEAFAGEWFSVKDYAKAIGQYSANIVPCMAEMASPIKKNKLSLLIQMFDPMGDYYESLRDPHFNKSVAAKVLGNGALAYIGMNAGEHMLHCQTMLAILNNIKLINTKDPNNEQKVSLYDALVVKERDGIYRLELDPEMDLCYERDIIDNEGTPKSNKNYGRPVKDENGKIKTERVKLNSVGNATKLVHGGYEATDKGAIESKAENLEKAFSNYLNFIFKKKKVVRKVNDSLNGAFGVNDKGAAHKKAVWRLVLQFRQWMPAHYERRFARAHYDADLEKWREGYYLTVVKTLNQLRKDLRKGTKELLKIGDKLNDHEKANLRRATAEVGEFLWLMWMVRLGGKVKDRDRTWADKMFLYQIRRMYLEVGASMPLNGQFFDNIFTLMQSPAASIKTFEKFSKVLNVWNMADEIESGRYAGWSEWERDVFLTWPYIGQITKAVDFDESMFSVFEANDD